MNKRNLLEPIVTGLGKHMGEGSMIYFASTAGEAGKSSLNSAQNSERSR
ncbi:MAG: hypothetical protein K6B43_13300 [Treponema sp.]|nr:hypothetical protein [Treponema sp.]